jgi:XTP/dITP diphosphohydrolase
MDRLRSPGGCPWDAAQTHLTLLPYLLEESHEVMEAVESGDRAHLREELGDLLLQVVFHARVAQEHPQEPFDVDDVAAGIVDKLVRRHPHVFADGEAASATDVEANWEQLKAAEKGRTGLFEGIPVSLPSLARAATMRGRLDRSGVELAPAMHAATAGDEVAGALLDVVRQARDVGVDAESALRAALGRLAAAPP